MNTNVSEVLRGASDRVATAAHGAREAGRELLHSEMVRKGLDRAAAGLDRAATKIGGHPILAAKTTAAPSVHFSPGEAVFVGVCAGGALALLFDPSRGRTRRALIRDQVVHFGHKAGDAAAVAYRDTRNRAMGLAAEARGVLESGEPSDQGQGEGHERPATRLAPATRAVLAIGCAAAATPFIAKAVASRQFLSMSPVLLAGMVGLAAVTVALQERSAQRHAAQSEREPDGPDPSAAWETGI